MFGVSWFFGRYKFNRYEIQDFNWVRFLPICSLIHPSYWIKVKHRIQKHYQMQKTEKKYIFLSSNDKMNKFSNPSINFRNLKDGAMSLRNPTTNTWNHGIVHAYKNTTCREKSERWKIYEQDTLNFHWSFYSTLLSVFMPHAIINHANCFLLWAKKFKPHV